MSGASVCERQPNASGESPTNSTVGDFPAHIQASHKQHGVPQMGANLYSEHEKAVFGIKGYAAQEAMHIYASRVDALRETLHVDRSGRYPTVVISDQALATSEERQLIIHALVSDGRGPTAQALNRRGPRSFGLQKGESFDCTTEDGVLRARTLRGVLDDADVAALAELEKAHDAASNGSAAPVKSDAAHAKAHGA